MPWLLIRFTASPQNVACLADALEACGALAVTIEGETTEQRLQSASEEAGLWSQNRVVGLFPEQTEVHRVLAKLREQFADAALEHEVDELPDADWSRAWMANYRPLQITPRLWICPTWCEPPDTEAINVFLDPGLAFGTGTHPTTALCLRWLADDHTTGRTLIDYGCGSGILAVAALKFGATRAVGVDVDPQALAASRENAARNGVGERYLACPPSDLATDAAADILVANILAGTLVELAPELARRVKPNGRLALSGVLTDQVAEVRGCYASHFALQVQEEDGWAILFGRKLA